MNKGHRVIISSLILAITLLLVAMPTLHPSANTSTCKYYFIIYGQDWCPHCQNMEKFVKETYGEECLEFRDLDVPAWDGNYTMIIQELNQKYKIPIQAAFPLTGILEDGKLRAIVLGEVTNPGSIDYIVRQADNKGKDWVAVFLGDQAYAIKPDRAIIDAYTPVKNVQGSEERNVNWVYVILGGLMVAAGVVGIVMVARK